MVLILSLIWILCAFLSAFLAKDKGHNALLWFLIGLIGGIISMVAATGLSDRKLRNYIRAISEKDELAKEENFNLKKPFRYREKFTFSTGINANENEVYSYLSNFLRKSKDTKEAFDALKIDSFEFSESILGGKAFIVYDANKISLIILTSQQKEDKLLWSGNF